MFIGLTRHILNRMYFVSDNSAFYIIYAFDFLLENYEEFCYTKI